MKNEKDPQESLAARRKERQSGQGLSLSMIKIPQLYPGAAASMSPEIMSAQYFINSSVKKPTAGGTASRKTIGGYSSYNNSSTLNSFSHQHQSQHQQYQLQSLSQFDSLESMSPDLIRSKSYLSRGGLTRTSLFEKPTYLDAAQLRQTFTESSQKIGRRISQEQVFKSLKKKESSNSAVVMMPESFWEPQQQQPLIEKSFVSFKKIWNDYEKKSNILAGNPEQQSLLFPANQTNSASNSALQTTDSKKDLSVISHNTGLTAKEEIEVQLQQNQYSRSVYDNKLTEIEQHVLHSTLGIIKQKQDALDRLARRTKVYNKHSVVESLESIQKDLMLQEGKKPLKKDMSNMGTLDFTESSSLSFCWINTDLNMWLPSPRIGSTLNLVAVPTSSSHLNIFLVGGISSEVIKDIIVIDTETFTYDPLSKIEEQRKHDEEQYQAQLMNKKSLQSQKEKNGGMKKPVVKPQTPPPDMDDIMNKYLYTNNSFAQRFNHSAVSLQRKQKLLLFGGEVQSNQNNSSSEGGSQQSEKAGSPLKQKNKPILRNLMNDIVSYDMVTREWRGHTGRGEIVQPRRNHTATMVGIKHMVVIGGLNAEGRALSDLLVLDVLSFRWTNVTATHTQYVNPFSGGIAFHATCLVSEDENSPNLSFFSNSQNQQSYQKDNKKSPMNSGITHIKDEGLFLFGGIDAQNNYIKNKMFVLRTNLTTPVWYELTTIGKSPEKRCMHSLNFMYNMSICVIYGGKFETQNSTRYFDDLHVLRLRNNEWIEVSLEGPRKPARAMHSACVYHKQLVIFGGLNDQGFLKGNIEIIELDQLMVMKMKRMHNFTLAVQKELVGKKFGQLDSVNFSSTPSNAVADGKDTADSPPKDKDKDNTTSSNKGKSSGKIGGINSRSNSQINSGSSSSSSALNTELMRLKIVKSYPIDPERERELKNNKESPPISPEDKWKPPQSKLNHHHFQLSPIKAGAAQSSSSSSLTSSTSTLPQHKNYLPPPIPSRPSQSQF